MSEANQKTDGNAPAGTEAPNSAAATQTPQSAPAAPDGNAIPEGFELIRSEDKKNLQAARDRANESVNQQAFAVNNLMKKDAISEFLKGNSEKYPDLSFEDLQHVDDPDDLESEAERLQNRFKDVTQANLLKVQRAGEPELSPDEIAAQEKKLKSSPDKNSFGKMLSLRSRAKK